MAEAPNDEAIFDASLKKKKKKKTGFNPDSLDGVPSEPAPVVQENGPPPEPDEPAEVEDMDLLGKKKKKKKSKPFNMDDLKESLPDGQESEAPVYEPPVAVNISSMDEMDMDFTKMKKKPKMKVKAAGIEDLLADDKGKDELDDANTDTGDSWNDSDRDYTYDELLQRAFNLLREKNPDMAAGEKKKFVMKPPQVVRIGSKKTAFVNFSDICRLLHRIPKHLLQFLLAELGTSGSIDGNNQLIIKGRFQQKQIENVLKRYIKEYVTCHTCRSPNTILQKDARLYFLQCEQCNSRCSVAPIKSGFQAVANKQQRQAIRASKN